jgi:class 3 adenylate cyclase
MTKSARQPILIAESTRRALLSPPDDLAYAGEFDVRGRQSTIRLWALASAGSAAEAARAPSGAYLGMGVRPRFDTARGRE